MTETEFRTLFDEHYGPLRSYALRRLPDSGDAEDVVIEVFTVVWRRRSDVPRGTTDQRMWMYGIARHTVANRRRSSQRAGRLQVKIGSLPYPQLDMVEPEDHFQASIAATAFSSLNETDQELIRLCVWEDLSHGEIGKVIDTPTPNVAVRLHRAKRKLRKEFARLMQEQAVSGQIQGETAKTRDRDGETNR